MAVISGLILLFLGLFASPAVVSLFLDSSTKAAQLAEKGFPLFSLGLCFITLNLVFIGFYQSIEQVKKSSLFMLLRGVFIPVSMFLFLPFMLDTNGLWLSIPITEFITFVMVAFSLFRYFQKEFVLYQGKNKAKQLKDCR